MKIVDYINTFFYLLFRLIIIKREPIGRINPPPPPNIVKPPPPSPPHRDYYQVREDHKKRNRM